MFDLMAPKPNYPELKHQDPKLLGKLLAEHSGPKVIARAITGNYMFYVEDKLTTTAGIKDMCEENFILIKNMIDNDFAEACS